MTDFLTPEELVQVARAAVGPGVLVADFGLLASAAARPQASVFGEDAYDGPDGKAAALLSSLVKNHALVDGNKRLAWAGTVTFCEMNGVDLASPREDDAVALVLAVADGTLIDVNAIARILGQWMRDL